MTVVGFLFLLVTDRTHLCLATLLAASFHELGHLLAAHCLHIPIRTLHLGLMGARIEPRGQILSYGEEWLLSAAGPLFSLLLSASLAPFWSRSPFAVLLSCISLLLGLLNLLPIRSFDGGRMLSCALSHLSHPALSERVLRISSFLCLFLLWCAAIYCLLRVGDGISLLLFSLSLLLRCFAGTTVTKNEDL